MGSNSTVLFAYTPRADSASPPVIAFTAPSRSSLFSSGSLTYTNRAPFSRSKSSRAPPDPPPPVFGSVTKLAASALLAYPPNILRIVPSTVDLPLEPLPNGITMKSRFGWPSNV